MVEKKEPAVSADKSEGDRAAANRLPRDPAKEPPPPKKSNTLAGPPTPAASTSRPAIIAKPSAPPRSPGPTLRANPPPLPGGAADARSKAAPTARKPAEAATIDAKPVDKPADASTTDATSGAHVALATELELRAEHLKQSDPIAAARAYVELGIHWERVLQDRDRARSAYETAHRLAPTLEPALPRIRRLLEGRASTPKHLAVLDEEIPLAEDDARRADLLAERARLSAAAGQLSEARASFAQALRLAPSHPASLRGLEAVLRRERVESTTKIDKRREIEHELAAHLERVADVVMPPAPRENAPLLIGAASEGDRRLAAWIHVERASLLDALGEHEAAEAALRSAVAFEPAPGPVRAALDDHLVRHKKTRELAEALVVESEQEQDPDRGARLLYTSARILTEKLDAPIEAAQQLARALARAPEGSPSARRIMTELIYLLETSGVTQRAAEVRRQRLALLADRDAIAHEHVRLCELFDQLGHADQAAFHAERALEMDPDDASTRERLDRALQRLGRHEDRVRVWLREANSSRPLELRVEALLRAADIANRQVKRRDEAVAHLRVAWSIDPGNTTVFDALSALLAPPPRDAEQDPRGVRARLDLYLQAASVAEDAPRKIGLLEKVVSIWEDELGQPARAIEVLERVLELEPNRRTAILALQRNAERAGDAKQLARALRAEADVTKDAALKRRLLLETAGVTHDRIGDRDRALALVEQALALDPRDPAALRARYRMHDKAGRHEEARRTLLSIIGVEPDESKRFALWIEIALLDEHKLKNAYQAVEAYTQAALLKPRHPLPPREITRLLRGVGDAAKLVEALMGLAASAADRAEYRHLLFQAAEVQELSLEDDEAALGSLVQADKLEGLAPDPALIEAIERIHVRSDAPLALANLYARWLERQPPAAIDHRLRIALAGVLAERDGPQSATILEGLLAVVPTHVPALRMLEQIRRATGEHAALASVLRAEADVFQSAAARCGALWEIVSLEEHVGGAVALEALARIVQDAPRDAAALEAVIRIAGKLTSGVAVPHPAALATRARIAPSMVARRELIRDPIARAMYELEEAALVETFAPNDPKAAAAALAGYRSALAHYSESLLAARAVERIATQLGDRAAIVESQLALARIVDVASFRAQHLVRAASIVAEEPARVGEALALYEQALVVDADSIAASQAIARLLAGDPQRLVDRLGKALERATFVEQVVTLGNEIARAVLGAVSTQRPIDPNTGIGAMRRVLEVAPDDVASLLNMAHLLTAGRVWSEARAILERVVEVARDGASRIDAYFLLSDLDEGPLADRARAIASMQAVLKIDEGNRRALERLANLAAAAGDRALSIQSLARLAELAPDASVRVEIDLRLAEACREAGDQQGRVRALADAVASAPNDARLLATLARLYRVDTPDGAAGYAKALQQVLEIASTRRLPLDHHWLTTLGLLEVTVLVRAREGLAHLQQAVALPGAPAEARVALGRGLEAAGRNTEAVGVLRDVLTTDADTFARIGPDLGAALAALESALAKEGRQEERLAVEEVRASLGEVKSDRLARLRARRAQEGVPYANSLAGAEIARNLLPDARSPLVDVAIAIAPIAAKVLRFDLATLGVSSRDRIRQGDPHPTRLVADRIARGLGVEAFDLYLTPTWQGAARVYPGDPAVLVGPSGFADLPDNEQAFALARLLVRVALGLTFLDELSIEALDGLFIATMRQIDPTFATGEISSAREAMAQTFVAPVGRAIGRRQKKMLEEIAASVPTTYDARAFAIGVRRSEYRIAYLLSGDLVSAIDYLRRFDREIARSSEDPRVLLTHPVTNELLRFALTGEAYAERRRIGAVWSG